MADKNDPKNDPKKPTKITDYTIYAHWLIIIIIFIFLLLLNYYSLQTLLKFCQIVLLFIFLLEVEV